MPGSSDCVSMIVDGQKQKVQKRLMLYTVNEAYKLFKTQNPSSKIGLTKFMELRPKNCVLPGGAGTHNVCVCTYHENVKLMISSSNLSILSKGELSDYELCIKRMICEGSTNETCFLRKCSLCSNYNKFKSALQQLFYEHSIDLIKFKQWTNVDRCDLVELEQTRDEFVEYFCNKLDKLVTHDFIKKQQSAFVHNKKNSLKEGEFLVSGDFAENYAFVIQDAAQAYHWNNKQATIHPYVVYNKEGVVNFVVISNEMTHDATMVYLFNQKLISFLRTKYEGIKKIYYVTDGAASQYKNCKNFYNLCLHEADYGIKCEWHFFATSHGKGPCDGIGGTVKRMARDASLKQSIITTPEMLYNWLVKSSIKNINFSYVSSDEYISSKTILNERYKTNLPKTIRGTQSFHCFVPSENFKLNVKKYSFQKDHQIVNVA